MQRVYIKYLQFDTLFFTFFKNGQFAMALRFVENYPLDKGETPGSTEAGVCGKYFADSIVSVRCLPFGNACDSRGRDRKNGQAYTVSRRRSGVMGPFPLQKNFFQKRVDFA